MSRGRRFSRGTGANRRVTTWASVQTTVSIAAANAYNTFDLLGNFKADGGTQQGITVLRTRLLYTTASALNATTDFVVGIIRGQNTDVGVSIAGAPTPDLDPYEDWSYWAWHFTDANGNWNPHGTANTYPLDLKAQRKLPELQMNYNMVIKSLAAPAYPQVFQVTGRVLLALP